MSTKIGKARYGALGQPQRKYFKLKDGEQAFRILPPLGELADTGRWSMFHSVHYGYKTSDGKQKPFLSPEVKNRKTNVVEIRDAAKERIEMLKAEFEKVKKSGNKAALDKLNALVGPTGTYNLDNNHYMNVVDREGNIGILKLRHRAKLALEAEIKKLNADGVDPLSPEDGRFFVFTRSGLGRDTVFAVRVLKEKMTVQGVGTVERDVVHKLDDELLNRLEREAGELGKLFRKLTAEQVSKVVETADIMTGVSSYLDVLFEKKDKPVEQATTEQAVAEESYPEPETEDSTAMVASVVNNKPTTAPIQNKMATVTEMDNDTFLKMLNEGGLS